MRLALLFLFAACATTGRQMQVIWADSSEKEHLWACAEMEDGKLTCLEINAFLKAVKAQNARDEAELERAVPHSEL